MTTETPEIIPLQITCFINFIFAVSTPSGSTAAPDASAFAVKDDAIPQGDSSKMEVEDDPVLRLLRAGRENSSGDSSATGGAL